MSNKNKLLFERDMMTERYFRINFSNQKDRIRSYLGFAHGYFYKCSEVYAAIFTEETFNREEVQEWINEENSEYYIEYVDESDRHKKISSHLIY